MKKKQKQLPFVLGMKLLSLYSFILGLGLLSVCFWTLLSFSESSMPMTPMTAHSNCTIDMPKPEGLTALSILNQQTALDNVNDTEIENVLKKVKDTWAVLSPFFIGSCGVTVLCGFIQIITSLVILCSSVPGAIKRARSWQVIHFILFLAFFVCLIIPVTIDKSAKDGGIWTHVKQSMKILERIKGIDKIDLTNVNNLFLFYITLFVNICGVLLGSLVFHFGVSRLKSKVKPGKVFASDRL